MPADEFEAQAPDASPESVAPRFEHWLLSRGARTLLVTSSPAATLAEVQARYPGATVRALSRAQWLRHPLPTDCKGCRHFARPGLSAGYCAGRDDLAPAYGPDHPLRRLPDNLGADCATWSPA